MAREKKLSTNNTRGSKASKNVELSFENIGKSRVYIHKKRSVAISEFLGTNKDERAQKIQGIKDFIFGKSDINPLQDITDAYNEDLQNLDEKVKQLGIKLAKK